MPHAIALFSGGLDSMLAARLVMEQGIGVIAIQFASPFFNDRFLRDPGSRTGEIKDKFGITAEIHDVSAEFLELLRAPRHGFGKNFNPCVDCKIFLLSRAKQIMEQRGAAFLVTGEVVGQRPMSQRRDTLAIIQRESGCAEILVRPLCARLLPPTRPERDGILDREQLLDFSGRGRSQQIALARRFGLTGYPSPAGGCLLTDPIMAGRVRRYYEMLAQTGAAPDLDDLRLLLTGRHFRLPGGLWLVMGRNEQENQQMRQLAVRADHMLYCRDCVGPSGILRCPAHLGPDTDATGQAPLLAAGLLAGYSRLLPGTKDATVILEHGAEREQISIAPLIDPATRKQYQSA